MSTAQGVMKRTDIGVLLRRLPDLNGAHVMVIGDVMLDHYVYGSVERVSPEAPVPVLRMQREVAMLGGAGNVARNLISLGARVTFLSVTGEDLAGQQVASLLSECAAIRPWVLATSSRVTSLKTRYVAGTQQLLRTDHEEVKSLTEVERDQLLAQVEAALDTCQVVVLSDYGKGVLLGGVAAAIIEKSQAVGRPVIVDPKGRDYSAYDGASVLTPNVRELTDVTGMVTRSDVEVETACRSVLEKTKVGAVLATRGPQGMSLVYRDGFTVHMLAHAREVFDVSGAGDTVVATLAASLAAGIPLSDAAVLANSAASVVVGKLGTATCSVTELTAALTSGHGAGASTKLVERDTVGTVIEAWRRSGLRIGMTNGCFDLLHPGHVSLIRQARALCDRLIVALNSDESVRRLKGEGRPVNGEAARATILSSLADVDLVMLFDEDTPLEVILEVRPDVLVKGADYTLDSVVGGKQVEEWGGKVVLADLLPGFSTTATIKRLAG